MAKQKTNFVLKKPDTKSRRSFSILKREYSGNTSTYKKIKNEALDSINIAYKNKSKTLDACTLLAKEVLIQLYKELNRSNPKIVHNSANRDLLEKYWEDEYSHRDLIDVESSKNEFKRAVEAVGSLSLYTATREDLQRQISKSVKGNKQRRIVSRLNALLKFIQRGIKLRKDKRNQTEPAHLSLVDFQKMIKFIEDSDFKLLCEVAFYSGLRIGEIFAITPKAVKDNIILVQAQIDRDGVRRETKNRIYRKAFVIKEGRTLINEWCKVDASKLRNIRASSLVRTACKKAFPSDKTKWIKFHDLRHSYAVHLLSSGVSLSLVAQSLGNSIVVCQAHYAGFTLADESINSIENVMNNK